MRHGPKRLKKAAGIRLDPKTGEWRPKFNKPSPDPQLAEKIRARYAEELAKPMPVEKPPFDWNRYQPLPGRVLLKVGAEIPVEKGVVIPESARINEEWLTVIAANGQFDFVIGDRVFVDKKAHRKPMTVNGETNYVLVKVRHIAAVLRSNTTVSQPGT